MRLSGLLHFSATFPVLVAFVALSGCGNDDSTGIDGGASGVAPRGTVSLVQYVTGSPGETSYAVAAYASFISGEASAPSCPVTTINAACQYIACPTLNAPTPSAGDGGLVDVYQAGTITVSGPSFPGGDELALTVLASGGYSEVNPLAAAPYFHGGDAITFAAPGDSASVGPFSFTVPAPADVVVTSPIVDGKTNLALSRSTDLTVTWQPGTPGTSMAVTLYQLDQNGDGGAAKSVSCVFDATAGTGTVPAAGGFAGFDVIDGTSLKGGLIVQPYSHGMTTTAAAGEAFPIYGTVTSIAAEGPFTLP